VTDRIEGVVARILNGRELVINKGASAGVEVGAQFAVLNSQGADIKDPETGESLGSVELPKVLVKIVQVYEKMSVASTFRTFKTGGLDIAGATGMAALFGPPQTKVETLTTDEVTYKEELNPEDSYVHIGDRVVEVLGDEFSGWGQSGR
jgi:hypothetical protein